MRLTATLLSTFLICTWSVSISAQQTHAKSVNHNKSSNHWIENNEDHASNAIQFSADVLSDAVELFWEVQAEDAVAGYELQRSIDGKNFQKIAWLTAIGESGIGSTYLHLDEDSPSSDQLQYRIKAVRNDGQYLYSSIQNIDLQLSRPSIVLSENVQPSVIALDDEGLDTDEDIELIDTAGKTLMRINPNTADLRMDMSDLKQGVYYIKMVLADGEDRVARVVKQQQ
ncbi:MAG: T9SS type A sorting domain-containing protein [Bacteroidota bacterium]